MYEILKKKVRIVNNREISKGGKTKQQWLIGMKFLMYYKQVFNK